MNYILDLFTPETWKAFQEHGSDVSGFSINQKTRAENIARAGDIFLCYLVRLSRWCGALQIIDGPVVNDRPLFKKADDPYVVRFRVKPLVILNEEKMIPLLHDDVWSHLSLTRNVELGKRGWTYKVGIVASLKKMPSEDGEFLLGLLERQKVEGKLYPLTEIDLQKLAQKPTTVKTAVGEIQAEIPVDDEENAESAPVPDLPSEERQSIKMQALICRIGALMHYKIWVPKSDRNRVLAETPSVHHCEFIDKLPLNYNDATILTIEQIDVLWLKNRSIVRAFEVEGTTAVYSGLLRMADLLALQPDLNIRLHIVAPDERSEKVMKELRRPVFLYLDGGPMSNSCSLITYSDLMDLSNLQHLEHMNSDIVSEYEQRVEDDIQ